MPLQRNGIVIAAGASTVLNSAFAPCPAIDDHWQRGERTRETSIAWTHASRAKAGAGRETAERAD
jgi:hypothetical protein